MNAIEVANSALSLLGQRTITSFTDGSDLAAKVTLRYSLARDAVLEIQPWNWAMVRRALTADATSPEFGWQYQYLLPTSPYCLKVRDTDAESTGWEVGLSVLGHRVILSNQSSLKIRYTARVEDLNIWSPTAVLALTYLLAADLAQTVTGQRSKADSNRELFQLALSTATTSDSREGSPVVMPPPQTLTAIR